MRWMILLVLLSACVQDIDLDIPAGEATLVVEGYINNDMPHYNYVLLGRSRAYFESNLFNSPVTYATVVVTEGDKLADGTYQWDMATSTQLKEVPVPELDTVVPGLYVDPRLATDPDHALRAKPGKHYQLSIDVGDQHYSAVTYVPYLLPVDSLTIGNHYYQDSDVNNERARLTVHYTDPDTLGNAQLFYWRHRGSRNSFGWGALGSDYFSVGADDNVNGQHVMITHYYGFQVGDTVQYYLVSADRPVYNFWRSYGTARANGGPFSTPVALESTVKGDNVVGCFSGFGVSEKMVIIQ